jgi:anti-anti-sigma regulatory factor
MTDSCVETRPREKELLIVLRGHAPLAEAETLLAHARAAILANRDIQLDLSDAEHLHAGVLQVLIAFERAARKNGLTFELVGQSEAARRALSLCGLAGWPRTTLQ